jgi:hypothetical protein
MRTEKQRQASRDNGAKSNGPATPEGKAISSRNGTTHGLCARDVLLGNENPELWQRIRQAFINHWRPASDIEALLADEVAATYWKLLRAESIETTTINLEMDLLGEEIEKTFRRIDEPTRQAVAFKSLADKSAALPTLDRHQTRLQRHFQRIWRQLDELVKSRPTQVEPVPAESVRQQDQSPCSAA